VAAKKQKLVYSTRADASVNRSAEPQRAVSVPPAAQTIRVWLDKKRRRGKAVSVARGFQLSPIDMRALQKSLKKLCGAGGTVKGDEIEIQGDHRDKIVTELGRLGYAVKKAGG